MALTRKSDPKRREERRQQAWKRDEARATRTDEQQLDLLNTRPGWSNRERERIEEQRYG